MSEGFGSLLRCPDCDLLQVLPPLPRGGTARCRRCRAVLARRRRHGPENAYLLTLAAAPLFLIANLFPFLILDLPGGEQSSRLLSASWALLEHDMPVVGLLVFFLVFLAPLAVLTADLLVLGPLSHGRRLPGAARLFRWAEHLRPWAMLDVYLLGIMVAYVKLRDMASIEFGTAFFAFLATLLLLVAADAVLEPSQVWERFGRQTRAALGALRSLGGLLSCHRCRQVLLPRPPPPGQELRCPRCAAVVHRREPAGIARSWAYLLAAAALYLPANILPVMTVTFLGETRTDTILSGVHELALAGMWPLAVLVFFASFVVPIVKMTGLAYLLVSVRLGRGAARGARTRLHRFIDYLGRWSMIDVFVIGLLAALVTAGEFATITPEPGAAAFALVVVLTMLASASFDTRLIWDSPRGTDDRRAPA